MADSDKNIIITPNRGATSQPTIRLTGQGNDPITLRVLDGVTGTGLTAGGALSFEGSAGQLFSIVNRLGTGSIFSVNDISGIPSIDVDASGRIVFAGFTGNVGIGATLPAEKLHVLGNVLTSGAINALSGLSASGGLGITGGATFFGNVRVNGNIVFPISGNGIDFSATTNSSGSMTSELFNDYEEGTWTPTITFGGNCAGQTYDQREGFYTKIGRLVTISAVTRFTDKGGSTGDCDMANLPFAVPVGQFPIPCSVWFNNVTFANQLIARTAQSTTTCRFQEITEAGVITTITNNDLGNNSHLAISVSFPI